MSTLLSTCRLLVIIWLSWQYHGQLTVGISDAPSSSKCLLCHASYYYARNQSHRVPVDRNETLPVYRVPRKCLLGNASSGKLPTDPLFVVGGVNTGCLRTGQDFIASEEHHRSSEATVYTPSPFLARLLTKLQ